MKPLVFAALLAFAAAAFAETPPAAAPEFVTQVLEPTGGKIKRPKDWFYNEDHQPHSYTWLLSREDASKGKYITGVRIQTLVGVKARTGKTPEDFVMFFVNAKKKTADKVIKSCDPASHGLFTRVCLETVEGDYHILYSVFWGNENMDVVVISTAGTTRELWKTYATTFDAMSDFELLDEKRFEKPEAVHVDKAQLVGHWRYTEGMVSSDYTFSEDGTYTSNIEQQDKVVWDIAGKWSLDGDKLNYELTKSSIDRVPPGTRDQDQVVEITKDYYVIMAGDGHKRKFKRVP